MKKKLIKYPLLNSIIAALNTAAVYEKDAIKTINLGANAYDVFKKEVYDAFNIIFENGDKILGVQIFRERHKNVYSITANKQYIRQRKRVLVRRAK